MHCHEHPHQHEHSHSHNHEHDSAHTHDHSHDAAHAHTHSHASLHAEGAAHTHEHNAGSDENTALLKYMLEHNNHHAEELVDLASRLSESGKNDAAMHLRQAINLFCDGNKELAAALDAMKG